MSRTLLILAALLLAFGSPAHVLRAGDFFVTNNETPTGGTGTAADPFGTITEALTSGALGPGDRLLVGAGGYSDENNETFPLVVPDGVSICAQGPGSAVITNLVGGPIFEVGDLANPASVKGFALQATTAAILFTGVPDDFVAANNTLSGVFGASVFAFYSDTGGSGCVTFQENWLSQLQAGIVWITGNPAGAETIKVVGNEMVAMSAGVVVSGSDPAGFLLQATGNQFGFISECVNVSFTGSGSFAVLAEDNDFQYFSLGLFAVAEPGAGDLLEVDFNARGNLFQADTTAALVLAVLASGASARGAGTIDCAGNLFENGDLGAYFAGSALGTSASAVLTGVFECNDVLNNQIGLVVELDATSTGAMLSCALQINHNRLIGNYAGNLVLAGLARSNATLAAPMPIYGNLIQGGLTLGAVIGFSESVGGTVNALPDLGGGPVLGAALRGCNTIRGNGTAIPLTATRTSLLFTGETGFPDLFAVGNWWVNDVLADIEDRVFHDVDGNDGHVDFSSPLSPTLSFSGPVQAVIGQVVVLTAAANSKFVVKAGSVRLEAWVGGVPTELSSWSPVGTWVSIVIPGGVLQGNQRVTLRNPGGQLGSLIMAVFFPSTDSGCFVATAAWGDLEAPEVRWLRRWRDRSLATNPVGRQLVKAYYALSPPLAASIAERPLARSISRAALTPVVGAVRLWLEAPWALGAAAALLLLRRARRRA